MQAAFLAKDPEARLEQSDLSLSKATSTAMTSLPDWLSFGRAA